MGPVVASVADHYTALRTTTPRCCVQLDSRTYRTRCARLPAASPDLVTARKRRKSSPYSRNFYLCCSQRNLSEPRSFLDKQAQGVPDQRHVTLAKLAKKLALFAFLFALSVALTGWAGAIESQANSSGGLQGLLSFILHLDKHLGNLIKTHGNTTYAILFGIVFCETGLVVTPFLPGDSLLFACGAFAALGLLKLPLLMGVFIVSAILGDAVNYAIGNYVGTKAVESRLVNKDYITKTEKFFKKHGAKTVVLARFVPIVRTFAPFVAGIGSMEYAEFGAYNVGGAILWTVLFVGAGYLFGNLPVVKHNFTLVILGIVVLSIVPVILEVIAARNEAQEEE